MRVISLDEKTVIGFDGEKVVIEQEQYDHTDHCWRTVSVVLSKLNFKRICEEVSVRCDRCGQEYPADVCHISDGKVVCPACWEAP